MRRPLPPGEYVKGWLSFGLWAVLAVACVPILIWLLGGIPGLLP